MPKLLIKIKSKNKPPNIIQTLGLTSNITKKKYKIKACHIAANSFLNLS